MVESFEVANERMSAVRYVADYTFHFRPSKVRRLVRVVEPAAAESAGKSAGEAEGKASAESGNRAIVVLPVYKDGGDIALWDDPNAWRAAWAQRSAGPGPARLILPLGDAKDLAAIDAEPSRSRPIPGADLDSATQWRLRGSRGAGDGAASGRRALRAGGQREALPLGAARRCARQIL